MKSEHPPKHSYWERDGPKAAPHLSLKKRKVTGEKTHGPMPRLPRGMKRQFTASRR